MSDADSPLRRAAAARPAPRLSFYEEQARRRAQARAWSAVAALVLGFLGWVLGVLVALAFLIYGLLLEALVPEPLGVSLRWVLPERGLTFGPLALGGMVFAVALWGVIRVALAGDASSGLLRRLGARPANRLDPEEQQLANVVEEMAIAATLPPPQLYLFDGDACNAGALGPGPGQATLLVSRRLLDTLDRDETQGVLGHLTASIVNGDLQLTAGMLRLFYALGLAVTILDLPFSARARGAMAALLRQLWRGRQGTAAEEDSAVAARLTASLQPEGLGCLLAFMQRFMGEKPGQSLRGFLGTLLIFPLLPLMMVRIGAALIYGLLSLFLLGPLVALILRQRRRLADATAVQLTRHPDGLACGLVHLTRVAHAVPGAGWAEMLFIVGSEAAEARRGARPEERLAALRREGGSRREQARVAVAAAQEGEGSSAAPEAHRHNFIYGFHPSLNSRIVQLKRLGATKVEWQDRADYGTWGLVAMMALFVLGVGAWMIAGLNGD